MFVRLIVCSIIINTIIYYNFFTVPVPLTHNKMTQYLYHFAEKTATEKRRRISEYIVHCSYFLKTYLSLLNLTETNFCCFGNMTSIKNKSGQEMIPLKSILHTENISVTFYTSNRYLLWQQMSKQPLNCLLKLPMCLPHGYKTDVKRVTVWVNITWSFLQMQRVIRRHLPQTISWR